MTRKNHRVRLYSALPAALAAALLVLAGAASALAQDTVAATEPNRGGEMSLEAQDPAFALSRLTPAEGYEVSLFASEKEFPIGNPVAMTFDAKGRLWVSTMPTYPQYRPGTEPEDRLVILEDTDGDGRADRHTVFADKLHLAAGFELGDGGAYVAQQPNLMFLKDTDGDDVADERHIILHGFGTEDSHHALSAFTWGPGGGLYFQEGTFHHTQVETPWGPVRLKDSGVFRYEPLTHKLRVFVTYNFANPWGHVFDRWGQSFVADASGGSNYFALPISGRIDYERKHPPMREFTPTKVRPTSGCEIVSSRHFPESAQGNFLINNTIGFHGIKQHRIIEEDSGFTAQEIEPLLQSSDINFRPVDLQFGPDGALYVVDWFNPLIGHMQYSLRDPRRDTTHGRIWRITYKGRPLVQPAKIAGQSTAALLELLKVYEDRTRYRVRLELRERDPAEVAAALKRWIAALDPGDKGYEHHLLEALWVYQNHDTVEPQLLEKLLGANDYHARAAATRALRYWQPRLDQSFDWLKRLVNDEHPRVRLEAVVAVSDRDGAEAAELALEALRHPMDYYLDYGLKETLRMLDKDWQPLLSSGRPFAAGNPAGLEFLLAQIPAGELVAFAPSTPVYQAVLGRADVEPEITRKALAGLAKLNGASETAELLGAIQRADQTESSAVGSLVAALGLEDAADLANVRTQIESLAREGKTPLVRQGAFAALLKADGDAAPSWKLATTSAAALEDFVRAVPLVSDPQQRASLYPKLRPLLDGLPQPMASQASPSADQVAQVRRAAIRALPHTGGHHAEIFSALAAFVRSGVDREHAIAALSELPKESWDRAQVRPLIDSLLAYAAQTPEADRGDDAFRAAVDFGGEIVALLPPEQVAGAQKAFDDLVVQVIHIKAVKKQLLFDKTSFVVDAGRPVEIVFDNPDEMPHNLLVVEPGALEEVGKAADAMASKPDAFEKQFVPDSPKVLWATPLLNKGESFKLRFTAPDDPGTYPYVCTFPGHWLTMNGAMYVRPPRP